MKKLFIALSALTLCSTAQAQLEKGRMMLGGSFNLINENMSYKDTSNNFNVTSENYTRNFGASLRYGYFISDGFMVGILGSYNNQVLNQNNTTYASGNPVNSFSSESTSHLYGGGAFARYYRMIGNSRFAWFGELSASYREGRQKSSSTFNGIPGNSPFSENKSINFNVTIRPGITYFFNKTIAAEASFGNLGYYYSKTTTGRESNVVSRSTTNSGINSNLNFSLSNIAIGINFYFGK